ncbi:uncharacterized protein JCM15063_003086 [Sporobolomyces koalae]|uniref:uncharacterized protein n=1 Tax=Sporobolomyces koalae TaxID=500713 RepID=UPI00317E5BD8
MLSRLKRRTASTSQPPDHDLPTVRHDSDDPPSPTTSRRTSQSANTTPSKQSVNSNRTLSPTRVRHYAPSMSRSSSVGSANGIDNAVSALGSEYSFHSAASGAAKVGQGSLSLEHLTSSDGSGPVTLVVQAPELIGDAPNALIASTDDYLATPTPGRPLELGAQDPSVLAARAEGSTLHASMPMSRPRAYTTSEALHPSRSRSPAPRSQASSVSTILPTQSGLDALAKINSPSDVSGTAAVDYVRARPHSSSVPTSPPSLSRPHSRSVSRPASRSPSFNAQTQARPDSQSLHPPAISPTRSRRNTKSSGASSGIAGAIALSGVALASPSAQLRHPLGLARGATTANLHTAPADVAGVAPGSPPLSAATSSGATPINGGGKRSAASSIMNGVTPVRSRDSIDSNAIVSPSESRRESESYASPAPGTASESLLNLDEHAFLSMDQLGDFDDVVSQLGTGYAVASSRRNAEFHALFKNISDDDYLIEDYGCALQRDILIQGRLFISEHHLSFYANIFGWVTSLTIPFAEVCSIEKRMTAYVIPNAIQIATMHARHTFASFLSRDTTYDLIGNIWRMVHPVVPTSAGLPDHSTLHDSDDDDGHPASNHGDDAGIASGVEKETGGGREGRGVRKRLRGFRRPRGGTGESSNAGEPKVITEDAANSAAGGHGKGGSGNNSARPGTPNGGEKRQVHPITQDTCPTLKNLKEVCMDTIFPSAPEKIYNLMFTSGFMRDFWSENQKLLDLHIGDWAPQNTGSNLLARSVSYIKPLNGSIGPKQTKCLITDESAHVDFDDFVCVVTTTRTPDVPSGSAFAVKTRTSMTWAKGNSCRVVVTTGVEWSKSSFIKGIIEKSCIDGQKTYHVDLEKAMRAYISTHRNEFIEEGQSDEVEDEDDTHDDLHVNGSNGPHDGDDRSSLTGSASADRTKRTWATPILDTLEPLVDLVSEQSPKTLVIGLVLVVLVLSNLWTLSSGRGKSASLHPSERGRPSTSVATSGGNRSPNVDPRSPDQVASAVRDVLQDYFKQQAKAEPVIGTTKDGSDRGGDARGEVEDIGRILDQLEDRIRNLRNRIDDV